MQNTVSSNAGRAEKRSRTVFLRKGEKQGVICRREYEKNGRLCGRSVHYGEESN